MQHPKSARKCSGTADGSGGKRRRSTAQHARPARYMGVHGSRGRMLRVLTSTPKYHREPCLVRAEVPVQHYSPRRSAVQSAAERGRRMSAPEHPCRACPADARARAARGTRQCGSDRVPYSTLSVQPWERPHLSGRQSSARASAQTSARAWAQRSVAPSVHAWAGLCPRRWSARACPSARVSALHMPQITVHSTV
jgi:hypothetical protein